MRTTFLKNETAPPKKNIPLKIQNLSYKYGVPSNLSKFKVSNKNTWQAFSKKLNFELPTSTALPLPISVWLSSKHSRSFNLWCLGKFGWHFWDEWNQLVAVFVQNTLAAICSFATPWETKKSSDTPRKLDRIVSRKDTGILRYQISDTLESTRTNKAPWTFTRTQKVVWSSSYHFCQANCLKHFEGCHNHPLFMSNPSRKITSKPKPKNITKVATRFEFTTNLPGDWGATDCLCQNPGTFATGIITVHCI